MNEILLLFLFQFKRWKHVRLVFPLADHLNVERISPQGVSLLESLHIQLDNSPKALEFLPAITDRAPQLRSLIWQVRDHPKPPMSDDTLQRLTELYLECQLSDAESLVLLKTCSNLRTCELENVCIASPPQEIRPHTFIPFKHETLRTLRLETSVNLSGFLSCLTLPSLESLAIVVTTSTSRNDCWAPSHLASLLSRSSGPLQSLLLENVPIKEDEVAACCLTSPALVHLNINNEGVPFLELTDKIVLVLGDQLSATAPFLCPKLETIKLCGHVTSSDGVFSNMVASRRNASSTAQVAPLKTVHVEFSNGPHELDSKLLKSLRGNGLVARIFTR
jgi:hypothetical protein